MKKLSVLLALVGLSIVLASCSPAPNTPPSAPSDSPVQPSNKSEPTQLKHGDSVSIVGQVAMEIRGDRHAISVHGQELDGRLVTYHCQFKDEFIEQAKKLKMADVAKISGSFLRVIDFKDENTPITIYLYDCEIVE